jgi:transposase
VRRITELTEFFNNCLELPGIKTESVERKINGEFVITVTNTAEGTICHKCGREITKFYGYGRETELRHLPILGHKTYIRIRPKRYECPYCEGNPTTTQKVLWYESGSSYTDAYEEHIILAMVSSTVKDVSMKEDIGYEAVMGIIGRRVAGEADWKSFRQPGIIGIDEISLKKGHNDFVTVLTSYAADRIRISGIISGREKNEVKKFLSGIPKRLRKSIKAVCCDMYEGYIGAAEEVFGKKVAVIADRFHVVRLYRKSFETLRKQEMKRLKKKLPEKEYKKLKGAMWALRKKDSELRSDEREVLRRVFRYSPLLKTAHELCGELTYIFNRLISKDKAKKEIGIWSELVRLFGMDCFETFLLTLERRIEEISNYFIERQTGGFVEGLNNKIKVIKRRCYGIFNVKHLFQRIFIDIEGYSLFGFRAEI